MYVVHYELLIQALKHGLKLIKIRRAIKFRQSHWLKDYIELNTNCRKVAKNDFEKDYFKLMNNAVFGKTMENLRKRKEIQLVSGKKKAMKLISKPWFEDRIIINENLVAIEMKKQKIFFDKPIQYVSEKVATPS